MAAILRTVETAFILNSPRLGQALLFLSYSAGKEEESDQNS